MSRRGFNDRCIEGAVDQQALGKIKAPRVARLDLSLSHEQALLVGQSGASPGQVQQPGRELGDLRGLLAADHADDGNTRMLLRAKQVLHDGLAHRTGFAHGGFAVHQETRAGIDFDDSAALLQQRAGDVLRHDVDARDIESDHPGGQGGNGGHIGVDLVGDVDVEIAVALHDHALSERGDAGGLQALTLDFQQVNEVVRAVETDSRQGVDFDIAPTRVVVDLGVDQLFDGRDTVARDRHGFSPGGGYHTIAHHQETMFLAPHIALDQHIFALEPRSVPGCFNRGLGLQIERDAPAAVAVVGFDHHGQANFLGSHPGRFRAVDQLAFGHRYATLREQLLGQVLVAGNALGDGAGTVGLGCPDAALARAIAQLHQVAFGEADEGNFAFGRSVHNAGGAGSQAILVHDFFQRLDRRADVKRAVIDGGHDQRMGGQETAPSQLFVFGADHDLVNATAADLACLAKFGSSARQDLQLDADVLHDVAHPGTTDQARQKAAPVTHAAVVLHQAWQPGVDAVVEAGNGVGGMILQFAQIDQGLDDGAIGPDRGAAQVIDAQDLDVREGLISHGGHRTKAGGSRQKADRPCVSPRLQSGALRNRASSQVPLFFLTGAYVEWARVDSNHEFFQSAGYRLG